ncbi:MAG TPA: HAD-IA family hydrolase [Burkholderiales bacterium]|nr:HAD-IA family hydrolase [Burkholderiales bacterium]
MIRAVLFDLDGTLADTAPDLARALNLQRTVRGLLPLPVSYLRRYASMGARGLIRAGFDLDPADDRFRALCDEFHELYALDVCRETRLFPGMERVLDWLEAHGLAWGIVTNKIERYTLPLVKALGLDARARTVVSGDTTPRAKPHAEPLLFACGRCGIAPSDCLYVGDDERDVQAAHAAGMRVAVARYGYLGSERPPETWGADALIDAPTDLLPYLSGLRPAA